MQHLNTLNQLVQAASQVTELARASQTYRFPVSAPTTFYLHVSLAEVRITRRRCVRRGPGDAGRAVRVAGRL